MPTQQPTFVNNINPFTGETVDPQIAKLTQEDYLASLTQKSPIVTSDSVEKEVKDTDKLINDIGEKKDNAEEKSQQDKIIADAAKQNQTDYDKETEVVNSYIDSSLKQQNDFFDSIYTATTSASDTLIKSLKDIYAGRADEMKTLNKATLGGLTKAGIRSGRNRYATVIESGILSAEESAGINRIKTLQAEEAKVIAEAQIAKTQNQWKLFNENRDKLTELHEKKLIAIKDQLDFAIKTEALAQSQSENALDKLKAITDVGGTISPDFASQVDATYGEGFASNYNDAAKLIRDNKNIADDAALKQLIVNLLKDTPKGETLTIGDKIYTGTKTDKPNTQEWLERDANNKMQIISYNQDTGKTTIIDTGVKSGVKSGVVTGGDSAGEKKKKEVEEYSKTLKETLDKKGKSYWGIAFKDMVTQFPDMPYNAINEVLGGGIPYDPATGTFDTGAAWGRAAQEVQ